MLQPVLRPLLRSPLRPATAPAPGNAGGSANILDFATLTPAALATRLGWVRTGAGTLVPVGGPPPIAGPQDGATYLMRAPDYSFGVAGLLLEGQRAQLLECGLNAALATQTKTVTAVAHTFSFYGTGSVVLSGAHSATVTGTGATVLTSLTFTPSAGSLTLTVSGTVTDGLLEVGSYPTSRIPNSGTGTVLRTADAQAISGSALDDLLGATRSVFTVVFEWFQPASRDSTARIVYLGNDSYSRRIDAYRLPDNTITVFVNDGTVAANISHLPALSVGAVNKIAIAVSGSAVSFVLNGSAGGTLASTFGGASMAEKLRLLHGPGASWMDTVVTKLTTFPGEAKSIAQMQAITV